MSSLFPNCLEEVPDYIIPNKVRDEYRHGDEVHGPRWGLAYKQRFEPEFDEIFANLRKQEKQPAVRTYKEFNRISFPRADMRIGYSVTAHVRRGGSVERDTTAPRMYEDEEAAPARAAPRDAENFFEQPANPAHPDGVNWWGPMADRRKTWFENWKASTQRPEDERWDEIKKELECPANPQTRQLWRNGCYYGTWWYPERHSEIVLGRPVQVITSIFYSVCPHLQNVAVVPKCNRTPLPCWFRKPCMYVPTLFLWLWKRSVLVSMV